MDKPVSQNNLSPWTMLGIHKVPTEDEDRIADMICENCRVDKNTLQRPFWVVLPFNIFCSGDLPPLLPKTASPLFA